MAIYLPFAADIILDLGYFGRAGKGVALLMLGMGIVYVSFFAPTRQDMQEHRKRKSPRDGSAPPAS